MLDHGSWGKALCWANQMRLKCLNEKSLDYQFCHDGHHVVVGISGDHYF